MGFRLSNLGFRVWGEGFMIQGLGFSVHDLRLTIYGSRFTVNCSQFQFVAYFGQFRGASSGFRVHILGSGTTFYTQDDREIGLAQTKHCLCGQPSHGGRVDCM